MTIESSYGMWWVPGDPNNRVSGQLTWEALQPPTLSLLDPPTGMWAGAGFEEGQSLTFEEVFVPMLHGTLADSGVVTLLDCSFGGLNLGATFTPRLRVGSALLGVWLDAPDEAAFRRVEIDLPGLEAMLGANPVRPVRKPTNRSHQVRLTLDDRRHFWKEGATEVTWEYRWLMSVNNMATQVEMIPIMILTNSKPKSLGYWLEEWIIPTNQLLTIATGAKSNPRSVTSWVKKASPTAQATGIKLWRQGVGAHNYESRPQLALLRAGTINLNPGGLPEVIRRVRQLSTDHDIFLSLLAGVINIPERPMRNRYLDLMSGLEAYHSQVYGIGPMSLDAFTEKRKSAVESTKTVSSADRSFIKRWLLTRPNHSLEYRLRQLASKVGILESWDIDPASMGGLRNDIAHGNTDIDYQILKNAYDQALDLGRRVALFELGIVDSGSP